MSRNNQRAKELRQGKEEHDYSEDLCYGEERLPRKNDLDITDLTPYNAINCFMVSYHPQRAIQYK